MILRGMILTGLRLILPPAAPLAPGVLTPDRCRWMEQTGHHRQEMVNHLVNWVGRGHHHTTAGHRHLIGAGRRRTTMIGAHDTSQGDTSSVVLTLTLTVRRRNDERRYDDRRYHDDRRDGHRRSPPPYRRSPPPYRRSPPPYRRSPPRRSPPRRSPPRHHDDRRRSYDDRLGGGHDDRRRSPPKRRSPSLSRSPKRKKAATAAAPADDGKPKRFWDGFQVRGRIS